MTKGDKLALKIVIGVAAPFTFIGALVVGDWTADQIKHAHKVWTLPDRMHSGREDNHFRIQEIARALDERTGKQYQINELMSQRLDEHIKNQKKGDENQDRRLNELESTLRSGLVFTNSIIAHDYIVTNTLTFPTNIYWNY